MAATPLLNPSSTVLLVCDVQERFRDLIHEFDSVVRSSNTLLDTAAEFGMDAIVTEQYPKGLLRTVPELKVKERANVKVVEKTKFSMMTPEVESYLSSSSTPKTDFIITGLETHVCVAQTTLELLASGRKVHIVVDGVSSQRIVDRSVAITRLVNAGAVLTTTESVMFMLLGDASSAHFKKISQLAKDYSKAPSKLGSFL